MFKKFFLFILTVPYSFISFSQLKIEAELGGSNVIGCTANLEYEFPIYQGNRFGISAGSGISFAYLSTNPNWILHSGANYYYKQFSIGSELSIFFPNYNSPYRNGLLKSDLIWFPNIGYTFPLNNSWYFKIAGGCNLPFARKFNFDRNEVKLESPGEVYPAIAIYIGRSITR